MTKSKDGYIETEVVIPEEWKVTELAELLILNMDLPLKVNILQIIKHHFS